LLGQGWSVILDSPSYYETIPAKGAAIAARRRVPYHFIECACSDAQVLADRLGKRLRMPSQPDAIDERETVAPAGAYLRVDTTQPLERCLALALEYLGADTVGESNAL
jgi:hypothetical protein